MEALVIYDNNGKVWLTLYGTQETPVGLPSMRVEIPKGAVLTGIDMETTKPIFSYGAEYYANQIVEGLIFITDVPAELRMATRIYLKEMGVEA